MVSPITRIVAAVVAVAGCSGEAPVAPPPAAVAPPSAAAAPPQPRVLGPARDTAGVPFDCTRIAPPPAARDCAPVPASVIELVETAQADAHAVTLHLAEDRRPHWARARAALAGISSISPATLPIAVRIAVQGAALRIAFDVQDDPDLVRAALGEVGRLALPAAQLQQLGVEPEGLEPWIGARDQWRTRERGDVISLHGAIGPHAHYRMIQGSHRAIAHQVVAIDTDGVPHVTPFVGELELRESDADDAVACVALLDVSRLGCGEASALVSIDGGAHASTHFFHPKPDGSLGCNDCHTSATFPIVDAARAPQVEADERLASISRIAERLGAVSGTAPPK